MTETSKKWYERIPHPVVMLFGVIVIAALLTYILPAGSYDRELVDGRKIVVPETYKIRDSNPVGFLDLFNALSIGFKEASDIIFLVLVSGVMFGVLEKSKMIENSIGTIVRKLGQKRKYLIVVMSTFVFGMLGVVVGYENNIAMIPIAAILSLAIGGDLILAAGISVAAITVGFGLSPINPYTVGIGHKIAELPLFSGALLRSILCFLGLLILAWYNVRYFKKIIVNKSNSLSGGLNTEGFRLSVAIDQYSITRNNWLVMAIFLGGLVIMLYGVFVWGWYLIEISSVFVIIGIAAGMASRMSATEFSETALRSIGIVAPGAFMVGYARTISVILEMGNISDTIAFQLAEVLRTLPVYASAIAMSVAQCAINFVIPSGSGQALATLPIMIPVGDVIGLTSQTSILAFQIGDGVTNLVNPTLGGLIAMLSLCRVPFDRWLRYILPLALIILLLSWTFLLFSVYIDWQ